nr:alpha/beta hydrolase [Qipengyuania sphaerica]
MLIHGGSWLEGTPQQFFRTCRVLADAGYGCISSEYRTRKSHGATPLDALDDCLAAFEHAAANLTAFGLPEGELWIGGASAGGSLALLAAGESRVPVGGLVLLNPVLDISPGSRFYEQTKDLGERFAPLRDGVSLSAPVLLLNGTEDQVTPAPIASRFIANLQEAGEEARIELVEGVGHGFFNSEQPQLADKIILAFLEET